MKNKKLTQERLKEVLHYNPITGVFTWKKTVGGRGVAGKTAGHISNSNNRINIMLDRVYYKAHRLAWFYMKGYFPQGYDIDHIDRNGTNNVWENLRLVSHQCNMRNRGLGKNNKSGVTGICWTNKDKRWMAQIYANKTHYRLGYFKNKDDAVMARWKAEIEHKYPNCNSTSSAYLYLKKKELI